ncbi:Bud5 protein [Candida orthopsilosis Co 90-125]|uniref:Bud5 protein n=1 Tax=Candida orthopsilosis (strain 90-125) TaxID=1136231 RepID=H8X5K2_CANO9|nr:Bud5 protein [Candida orthopsilosis Co 90-125]CCG23459.1 Bud5 protein [Candida orthopsilosis Co 90-125]
MEQSSPYNYSQGIKHASVASSVYSPIQTEFVPESNAIMEEDEDEDEDEDEAEQQQEQPPQHTQENSVDEIEEVSATSDESDGQSDDETVSHDGVNNDEDRNGLIADRSTQTIQTFMTANTRLNAENISQTNATGSRSSLTPSTNESSNNSATQLLDPLDTDATPVLTNAATNTDKTPIVSPDGFVQTGIEQTTASLPQRKLSKKFKRLSMKLQNATASENSSQFMSNFQQNIERANNNHKRQSQSQSQGQNQTTNNISDRTSTYYTKITERTSQDIHTKPELFHHNKSHYDTDDAASSVLKNDQHSELSSVSSRASSTRSQNSINHDDFDDKSSTSSTNIAWNNNSSSYNLRGSLVGGDEEVPVRRDLIETPTKEKFKLYNKSNANLSEQGGLNIIYDSNKEVPSTNDLNPKSKSVDLLEEEEDLSSLFIRALHAFDSSTLQSESDSSICLSFAKDDLAFVHTIDESGWGEVTLIESLERGWIPMNYFTTAVAERDSSEEDEDEDKLEDEEVEEQEEENEALPNSHYIKPLFHACGKFLMNPLSHRNRKGRYTFSIRVVNSIRDGVRVLLQQTDCLSRSNEIVTKRQVVRKARKSLLADWYNLMVKANEFKGTSNFSKIEILTLMVYQVTRKATEFLEVWSIESKQIVKRANERKLHDDLNNYPLLEDPPLAKQRITEINGILYSYLGLIIGRMDLIEHNQVGCEILETLAHQIILLLRELLFISKTGSDFSLQKPDDLDNSLDGLLSLVSDLVTGVKSLVVKTINEGDVSGVKNFDGNRDYFYTQEGGDLLQIAAKMIKAVGHTVASVRKLLDITGDFKLNSERSYPDYLKMRIEPQDFVRRCMKGIKATKGKPVETNSAASKPYKANRYSMVRSGKSGELGITESGQSLLQHFEDSPFTASAAEFEPFTSTSGGGDLTSNNDENLKNELLTDKNGFFLGGSFKGLVYTLTNEQSPPEYFYVSTFFICFRNFANGMDLIEELVARFEANRGQVEDINLALRLKNRRKLIVKMFQLWMESYWNQDSDYSLLTTMINFFNEGVSPILPLDALELIEIGAKLSTNPLIENRARRTKPTKQLVERNIVLNSTSGQLDFQSLSDGDYDLSRVSSNASNRQSLPLPSGATPSNSLLTLTQTATIEKIIMTYRSILKDSWCSAKYLSSYKPLNLSNLLSHFAIVCEQNWVLSNYRPNLLDFNALEVAKQLTLIESNIFCSIKPDELLNQNFTNKRAHLRLSPNVRLSLLFTNCLSNYVLESILQPNSSMKERVNTLKVWLKVAISSLYLRNFNGLAAITTALQSHLITRIDDLWTTLSQKYVDLYQYLSSIISMEKNYSTYRNKIRNLLSSGESLPIVPYINLFISDITTTTEGIPKYIPSQNFLSSKVINFQKYSKIVKIIADLQSLQNPYSLENQTGSSAEYRVQELPSLQELILLELWKVNILHKVDDDRGWKLSCDVLKK